MNINKNNLQIKKLSSICTIATGKLDANAGSPNGKYKFFTCSKEDSYINSYAFEGTAILIAGNGDVGHTKLYNGRFNAYQRTYVLQNFSESPYYIKQIIDLKLPIKVKEELQGGAMPYIKLDTLANLDIPILPKEEQEKISNILSDIDAKILNETKIVCKLKNIKQSFFELIFPSNNNNIPQLRFEGFTDAWEQRKLLNITFLAGERNRNNLPYESYSINNEQGFVPQNEQFEKGGSMTTADKTLYNIVSPKSFAYNPARINVGSIGYYEDPENVIVSSLYEVFKTTDDINDRFLWHWFKTNQFQKMIEKYQEGGVRLYFYYDKLCMCSLKVPHIEEQNKIASTLDNLDNLIALHQRKPFYSIFLL